MPTEIVDKMIALGMIPEEFDRKILSNAILEYFKNLTENVPSIEPKQAVDILDLLNAMNKKLDELRGKQPPQIA